MANIVQSASIGLHHLRSAVAAADCGSFRQAAELLAVRHSVLSRSIKQFEHLLGVALFERSTGGVAPTAAGRRILRLSRMILEQVDTLVVMGRTSGRGEEGRLAAGFCTSMSAGNLRASLMDFKKRFPQVELATVERSRIRLVSALRSGALDVVITPGRLLSDDCRNLLLWSERVMISIPEDHILAARETVFWTDLRNETVLLSQYDPGRELEDLLTSKLALPEDRPKIERHDVSRGIIKSLVSMGMGAGLAMESDVGASFAGLVYRELRDGTGPSRIDFYAHWRVDNENPVLLNFLDLLTERYPTLTSRD
ncbi:LysR family transcriptional regulator [Bradyrhizobium mercantei]|uniref:LysR family transcriptional regulator n=1 Tax=Bradyrhizobium mercantei TaxID=1904807 RepID=UPI000975869C|nr:LysR family transcriptional regulator [Bradyrhizobium mercantei]